MVILEGDMHYSKVLFVYSVLFRKAGGKEENERVRRKELEEYRNQET